MIIDINKITKIREEAGEIIICNKNHFREMYEIYLQLKEVKGSNLKKEILIKNKENLKFKKLLQYIYNPYNNYGVSSKIIKKHLKMKENKNTQDMWCLDLFAMLDCLNMNNINNGLRNEIAKFLLNLEDQELIDFCILILTKNLKCSLGASTINSIYSNLIPTFELQAAEKYYEKFKDDGKDFIVTEKIDGIRIAAFIKDDKNIKFRTRSGLEMKGLNEIKTDLKEIGKILGWNGFMFDGEVVHKNPENLSSDDNFNRTSSIVNSDMENKTNLIYKIFDVLTIEDFENKQSKQTYFARRRVLDTLSDYIKQNGYTNIEIVEALYRGNNSSEIIKLSEKMIAEKKEGVMINFDTPYYTKRHSGMLKLKEMETMDVKVLGVVEGKGDFKGTLGAIIVDYNGEQLHVGSGFKEKERHDMWKNPEDIIDKIVEVQYFRPSKNKSGLTSVRFPIFKCIRFDKNEPNI